MILRTTPPGPSGKEWRVPGDSGGVYSPPYQGGAGGG